MKKINEYQEIYVPYRRKNKKNFYCYARFNFFRRTKSLEEMLDFDNKWNRWAKAKEYSLTQLLKDIKAQKQKITTKEEAKKVLQDFINNL